MEGMPVSWYYPYRYLHLWEAEVPVGINIHAVKTMLLFADKSTGPVFSVVTYTRADWDTQVAEDETRQERKTWDEVAEYHVFLPEDASERKPLNDREHWNEEMQRIFHIRDWRFRGENFLIMIVQHRLEMKNPAHDSVVDRFVNTLKVMKV